ncbi:hypothetical protein DNTS_024360 [Danionella cerebrum]|uniref:PDZ domain-containing protein n=1 Tax=Danionella cerebrum TaxID=2873325 RepID=A0A553QSH9_9TELE|nr:hypothetical protein DNTS_024360 [Danionella translucida]
MTSNKNLNMPLNQTGSLDTSTVHRIQKKKSKLWRQYSFNGGKHFSSEELKGRSSSQSQLRRTNSTSLVDYTDPQRTRVTLVKQDNEVYGFEVQTYGLKVKPSGTVEMCTFVSSVQDGSAAETAGLTAGDVILSVNDVSIEGSGHHRIIELIRESTHALKLETVSGSVVKRIELEKKLHHLKQTLREKWVELQSLTLQEKRITQGNKNGTAQLPSLDSLMSLSSPDSRCGQRFSSSSSVRSLMSEGSEDGAFMSSVFDDSSPFSPVETNSGFFQLDSLQGLRRTRSNSNSSLSPTWDNSVSSVFGTLPRRLRKGSVRKHIMKFLPGMSHSVEEEEVT